MNPRLLIVKPLLLCSYISCPRDNVQLCHQLPYSVWCKQRYYLLFKDGINLCAWWPPSSAVLTALGADHWCPALANLFAATLECMQLLGVWHEHRPAIASVTLCSERRASNELWTVRNVLLGFIHVVLVLVFSSGLTCHFSGQGSPPKWVMCT